MAADNSKLNKKINALLNEADRMTLATSSDGNTSASSVFFARDGQDIISVSYTHLTLPTKRIV